MKFSLLLPAVVASASIVGPFDHIVTKVNTGGHAWKSEAPERFASPADAKILCGTWTKGHPSHVEANLTVAHEDANPATDIPQEFDARTNWPKCSVISTVRDQSACGSCWAFASTEAFEDSRCIATGENTLFSPEDTAGCCSGFACGMSQGCNGGQPSNALNWMTKTGVVTGGDYFNKSNAEGGCKPYSLAPCAHHVPPTSKYPKCPQADYTLNCKKTCTDSASNLDYSSDKQTGVSAHSYTTVEGMQTAIMTTGPLAVAFTVYEDFPTYKSGVYHHVSGSALGGHAVEMVGWGVENGVDYWLIKNSWNNMWGDGGFFKIKRGVNECGIEDDVTGIKFQ